MNITLSKLKQLIKEELQNVSLNEEEGAADNPVSQFLDLARRIGAGRDGDGAVREDDIPGGFGNAALLYLKNKIIPSVSGDLKERALRLHNDIFDTLKQIKNAQLTAQKRGVLFSRLDTLITQKWSQLQTAIKGSVSEGKLTKAEKEEKKNLKAKKNPTEKDEKRLKAIQHK